MPAAFEIRHSKLQRLLAYWRAKSWGSRLPARADIDPLEMTPWLGHLLLIEPDPIGDYRYRLYGTEFVEAFGRDMTGRTLASLPQQQHRLLAAEYGEARIRRAPLTRVYTADFPDPNNTHRLRRASWERLVLPLASDGANVDMLLVGAYPLDEAASPGCDAALRHHTSS